MGQFVSRVHNKQDDKLYNILPTGDMPTVVFGRVIRPNSVPGMQYYFSDGRVKFEKGGPDTMSKGGGWDAVIPFTKPKVFTALKFNGEETWLYRRYPKGDRGSKGWYAWAFVNNSSWKDINDTTIDWGNLATNALLYTSNESPNTGEYNIDDEWEIIDKAQKTSDTVRPTQVPCIFTVPENLDFTRMSDVEYVKQFCRTAEGLNANTMSPDCIIMGGKITCIKQVDFGKNKILTNNVLSGSYLIRCLRCTNKKRMNNYNANRYKEKVQDSIDHCVHNKFTIIPTVYRGDKKTYKSIYNYPAYRYGVHRVEEDGNYRFAYWLYKLQ